MGHAASILKDDTPVFKISSENPNFSDLGVLGSMELIDTMGDDLSIVNAARVSYASESNAFEEKDKKLVKYLAKHKHWTPFQQNSLKFRV
jgi:thymidylate synthase ThyX